MQIRDLDPEARRVDVSSGVLTFVTEKSCRAGITGKHTFARAATEQTFDPREAVHSISGAGHVEASQCRNPGGRRDGGLGDARLYAGAPGGRSVARRRR